MREEREKLSDVDAHLVRHLLIGRTCVEASLETGMKLKTVRNRIEALRRIHFCATQGQLLALLVWEGFVVMPDRKEFVEAMD